MTDPSSSPADIAIVGIACRLPGATGPDEYWSLLREGREARTELTDDELRSAGVPASRLADPNYVKAGMFLPRMDQFDPGFFGFSPLDGRILDPQHRHFLECAWEALEDAGYDPFRFAGAIGVFAGSGHNAYLPCNLLTNPDLVEEVGLFLLRHTGNDKDFLATRVSYCFDLKGPSVNVQTACSTSLVAVHQAAQSLINGECDMALAGGVTIELPHRQGYLFKDSEILSRDGHCRPFDRSAGGTVFGSGVGVVVLKRLQDAVEARDHIHAVIKASAVNNDGAAKVSYLAPSVDGQAAVIAECLSIADVAPESVSYVAAHGTGTQLGDPIEVAALTAAYGGAGAPQHCAIGSVKSNIGHTDTAAGVASLIGVVLAMAHRELPPTLHFEAPNPAIDFARTPFFVCDRLRTWSGPLPLRAGVSSLGVGGTNAHVIVEQAPARAPGGAARTPHLLLLSARNEQPLLHGADRLARFLEAQRPDQAALSDVAFTLAVGRRAFRRRAFAVVSDSDDAVAVLDGSARDRLIQAEAPDANRPLAFMFAGGGAQYPGMGRGLYESEPVYRETVTECLRHLSEFVDFNLADVLFAADTTGEARAALERPSRALPALFITQYAQARLWQSWGITPDALIGHSMGENTAACLAGVFSLRDALGLVALRGRLFETVGDGAMLSVDLDEQTLTPLLTGDVSIAAVNAPSLTVASGPTSAIRQLEEVLETRGVGYRRIHIDVAAHSGMLEPILRPFGDYLRSIRMSPPVIPFVSNRTGTWITTEQATSPDYWVDHLRHTVRFADGIATLLDTARYTLLEVGPGRTLASLAASQERPRGTHAAVTSMRHPDEPTPDVPWMLTALGRLWQAGTAIDWERFYQGQARQRVSLPTYAFEHVRCWVEPGRAAGFTSLDTPGTRGATVDDWLYHPIWSRTAGRPGVVPAGRALVLAGRHPAGDAMRSVLSEAGIDSRLVHVNAPFEPGTGSSGVNASREADWLRLVESLRDDAWVPSLVVNLLPLELTEALDAESRACARALTFDAMLNLAQAAGSEDWKNIRWLTVSCQATQVAGESIRSPFGALALGPTRVLPREFPSWTTRLLDIAADEPPRRIAELCLRELSEQEDWNDRARLVAVRGKGRFVQRFVKRRRDDTVTTPSLSAEGVYLITGGTGGLGLVAAEALATHTPATFVLVSRHGLPDDQYWEALIAANAPESAALSTIRRMRAAGATVLIETADVTDRKSLASLAARISPLGSVRGILHTAGSVDDAPVLAKDLDGCHRVMAPKVDGALNLDDVFGKNLDFVVLYSSTSAWQGLPGQVDYTAANAFLDAWAQLRSGQGARYVSINWPAWREVGMAAAASRPGVPRVPPGRPLAGPLLHRALDEEPARSSYASVFDVPGFWILNEHRVKDGPALVPGAAFLEIARAAFVESIAASPGTIDMREVAFDAPFVVGDSEQRVMRIDVANNEFVISSDTPDGRVEHARGLVGEGPPLEGRIDIDDIRARCVRGRQGFSDPDHHPFLSFGERWQCLREVLLGDREALIELQLDDRFAGETEAFPLHPALLDMATAGAQAIIDGYQAASELFVPIGCVRLTVSGPLPGVAFSHVRYQPAGAGVHARDIARFDVTIARADGSVVLRADGYTLRRVTDPASLRLLAEGQPDQDRPVLRRTLELGIDPAEGRQALLALLPDDGAPQCLVSPFEPEFVLRELLAQSSSEAQPHRPAYDADADADIPLVEAALRRCEAIHDVFVRSFRDSAGERRLVAFFVPDLSHYSTVSDVRRFARTSLPGELMPAQIVELDEVPRREDGSVDRTSLRDPLAPQDTHVAPRTPTEKAVARVWQDVLGVDRVGLTDNFFDLGGHSLLSTRVIVQLYKKLQVRLDQPTMVLHTLEQIAREIDGRRVPAPLETAAEASVPSPVDTNRSRGLFRSLLSRS